MFHMHTLSLRKLSVFLSVLPETLLWIKFSSSVTEPTGFLSVVLFWSDYSDQRQVLQSTPSRLWCVFVSSCLKMPELVCQQIHFCPSVIQPRYICSHIRERGLWVERGAWGSFSFGNGLGKHEGNVDRDNSTVKVLWRQIWENIKFK